MKKDSANTAMVVVGLDYAMNKYVLDGWNHKMPATGALAAHERLVSEVAYIARRSVRTVGYERYGAIADLTTLRNAGSRESNWTEHRPSGVAQRRTGQ